MQTGDAGSRAGEDCPTHSLLTLLFQGPGNGNFHHRLAIIPLRGWSVEEYCGVEVDSKSGLETLVGAAASVILYVVRTAFEFL